MSGRRNLPLQPMPELVDIVTKLRRDAASSPDYRALETEFTAILQHVVFPRRRVSAGGEP